MLEESQWLSFHLIPTHKSVRLTIKEIPGNETSYKTEGVQKATLYLKVYVHAYVHVHAHTHEKERETPSNGFKSPFQ